MGRVLSIDQAGKKHGPNGPLNLWVLIVYGKIVIFSTITSAVQQSLAKLKLKCPLPGYAPQGRRTRPSCVGAQWWSPARRRAGPRHKPGGPDRSVSGNGRASSATRQADQTVVCLATVVCRDPAVNGRSPQVRRLASSVARLQVSATHQADPTVVCRATGGRAPPQGRRTSPQCGWA